MDSSRLVHQDRLGLSRSELALLLSRAELRRVLGPWLVAGHQVARAAERWQALEDLVDGRLPLGAVISEHTAAWLWLGGPSPERISFRVPKVHRGVSLPGLVCMGRDAMTPEACIARRGALAVTSPVRTAVDLMADAGAPVHGTAVTLRRLTEPLGFYGLARPPTSALGGLSERRRRRAERAWLRLPYAFR